MTLKIKAKSYVASIEPIVEIPTSFRHDQPITWKGSLAEGQEKVFTTRVETLEEGYWLIVAQVPSDGVYYPLFLSTYRGEEKVGRNYWDVAPKIDFFGNYTVEGEPRLSSVVNVTYTLTSSDTKLVRSENTTIHTLRQSGGTLSVPRGAQILSGSMYWAGRLLPGGQAVVSWQMRLTENTTVRIEMMTVANFNFTGESKVESYPSPPYYVWANFHVYEGTWEVDREGPTTVYPRQSFGPSQWYLSPFLAALLALVVFLALTRRQNRTGLT